MNRGFPPKPLFGANRRSFSCVGRSMNALLPKGKSQPLAYAKNSPVAGFVAMMWIMWTSTNIVGWCVGLLVFGLLTLIFING